MTETTSGGQAEPAALVPEGARVDPLNAAIAATAGERPVKEILGTPEDAERRGIVPGPSPDVQRAAAMEAYIQAGVAKAVAAAGNAEIVTVAAFREALDALFRHLHLDHPENYLPKG